MATLTIERSDLEPILAAHTGNRVFEETLQRIKSKEDLICMLGRYADFNAVFGGSISILKGKIALQRELFRDPADPFRITADRSNEVAAAVGAALVDEFGDRTTPHRSTHRTLAQATLRAAGRFFGYEPAALNAIVRLNEATRAATRKVLGGYGVDQPADERTIFPALGLFMGSEFFAGDEYNILDRFLRTAYPALVANLELTEEEIAGLRHPAYHWVPRHTSVEPEHFEWAMRGANLALRYYVGRENQSQLKSWILDGFAEFTAVQTEFMTHLMDA